MENLTPQVVINYEGRDVTADFEPILSSVSYRDYLDGKAGELEIRVSNAEHMFLGDWYPATDDRIGLRIGYREQELLDCGTFWVDEARLSGSSSGEEATIRALSLRSSHLNSERQVQNFDAQPLQQIVETEARRMGYKVLGDLSGTWSGQQTETGLRFINRVAHETGRIFKLEQDTLVFYPFEEILRAGDAIEIDRRDVSSYDISDKAAGRIGRCTVKWWNRKNKTLVTGSYDAGIKGGGSALIWQEVKDRAEAEKKAKDYITDRNKTGVEFSITTAGDVRLQAGATVKTSGFGRFDDSYIIGEVMHSYSSGGYTSQVTLIKPGQK